MTQTGKRNSSLTEKTQGTPKEVRNFGILFAVVLTALAVYFLVVGKEFWHWFLVCAGGFLLAGTLAPALLRPLYRAWMKLAFFLAWVNTRLLLGLFFYLVLTPIGVILRLTGKDLLGRKLDREAVTYWKKREGAPVPPQQYERLF